MKNLSDTAVKEILDAVPEGPQKDTIRNILSSKIAKNVLCMSEVCNGRVVAQIYSNGKIQPTIIDGVMWLFAYRHRLDGNLGFQCACGNDSRLCEAEKGVSGIENNNVQKEDIAQVHENLEKKRGDYPVVEGKQYIDNFIVEEL